MATHWLSQVSILLILCSTCSLCSYIKKPDSTSNESSNHSETIQLTSNSKTKRPSAAKDPDLASDDAQSSANFYPSDLDGDAGSYDPATDYGAFFDHFSDLPYFPEFGEIFRLSRTTTPQPPFRFPSYVRNAFPDGSLSSSRGSASSFSDSIRGGGGRRPGRRPPRPASSGTRTKVSKHNQSEVKEKPRSPKSSKSATKARNFPKIFRFTADRVNLADFDMKKKVNENYLALNKGDDLDSDKVKRNEFLILHGGVFEIETSGRSGLLAASSNRHIETTSPDSIDAPLTSNSSPEEEESVRYFYKT